MKGCWLGGEAAIRGWGDGFKTLVCGGWWGGSTMVTPIHICKNVQTIYFPALLKMFSME